MKYINVYFEKQDTKIKYNFYFDSNFCDNSILLEYLEFVLNNFYFSNNDNLKFNYLKILNTIIKYLKKMKINNKEAIISKLTNYSKENMQFQLYIDYKMLDNEDFISFLKNCKYKIIINTNDSLKLYEIIKKYNLFNSNIYINYQFNSINSNVSDFMKMISSLKNIINFIKGLNLSQIEQIMLVYDIVKSNEYNEENKNDKPSISRDLHSVINGNNIVCVGFTNYFNFLLNELGITSNIVNIRYRSKFYGHERSLIGVNDTKYNIKSVLMCDPTWDSKRNDNYIDNYKFFLKSFKFFSKFDPKEIIDKPRINYMFKDNCILANLLDDELEKTKIIMEINRIYYLFNKNYYIDFYKHLHASKSKLLDEINECKKLLNTDINIKVFIKSLYKVRRVEYINNLTNELPTKENISNIIYKRYNSLIYLQLLLDEDKINYKSTMLKIYNIVNDTISSLNYDNILDTERIKLIKILKQKTNNEIVIKKIKKNK